MLYFYVLSTNIFLQLRMSPCLSFILYQNNERFLIPYYGVALWTSLSDFIGNNVKG